MKNINRTNRVAIVMSIAWVIFAAFLGADATHYFRDFTIFGLAPVGAYWGWRFINADPKVPTDSH